MSSYLSLILYSSKADSYILSTKRLSYSFTHTCFACSRCTGKQNNRACILLLKCHYRNLLGNSFFRLLKAMMALIKYFLCPFDIYFLFFFRFPAKSCNKLKIFKCGAIFMVITSHLSKLVKYPIYLVFNIFRESCFLYFTFKPLYIREFILIIFGKFVIKQFYLPPDHTLSVIITLLVLDFLVNIYLKFNKIPVLKHCLRDKMVSLHKRVGFKHCIFLFHG